MHRLKVLARAVFLGARRVLVPASLFCLYFLVLGPTALVARLLGLIPEGAPGPAGHWRLPGPAGAGSPEPDSQS